MTSRPIRAIAAAAPLTAPLAALVAAGAELRLALLGSQQLFRDEATSWYLASHPLADLPRVAAKETFPPLYSFLLKGWMLAFGDSEAALRSLSVVFGIATIVVVWRWARDAMGRTGAWIAAALVAASPAMLLADRNARMYSLETFFATTAWWLAWRLVADGGEWTAARRRVAAVALAGAVAGEVWTLSLGIPTAGLQLAFVAVAAAWTRGRAAGTAVVAVIAGGLTLLPWLPNLLSVATNGQAFWTPRPGPTALIETAGYWIPGRVDGWWWVLTAIALALAAAGVATLLRRAARRDRLLGVAALLGVAFMPAVWAYSQLHSIYDPRYLGPAFPPLALAVAAGATTTAGAAARAVRSAMRRRPGASPALGPALGPVLGPAIAVLLIVPLLAGSVANSVDVVRLQGANSSMEPAQEVVAKLSELVRPGDIVITLNAQTYFPLAYYLRDGRLAKIGAGLYDWHRPNNAFYTGWQDIDSSAILDSTAFARDGWAKSVPANPGATIWLVALANPAWEFRNFAPLHTGELRETSRIDIRGAQIRSAVLKP